MARQVYMLAGFNGKRMDEIIGTFGRPRDAIKHLNEITGLPHSWVPDGSDMRSGSWRIWKLDHNPHRWL